MNEIKYTKTETIAAIIAGVLTGFVIFRFFFGILVPYTPEVIEAENIVGIVMIVPAFILAFWLYTRGVEFALQMLFAAGVGVGISVLVRTIHVYPALIVSALLSIVWILLILRARIERTVE